MEIVKQGDRNKKYFFKCWLCDTEFSMKAFEIADNGFSSVRCPECGKLLSLPRDPNEKIEIAAPPYDFDYFKKYQSPSIKAEDFDTTINSNTTVTPQHQFRITPNGSVEVVGETKKEQQKQCPYYSTSTPLIINNMNVGIDKEPRCLLSSSPCQCDNDIAKCERPAIRAYIE